MDIEAFLSSNNSMIIAPAGYGKTYTIAECLAAYRGNKKVLVLTHTHAGIASLKEKIEEKGIPSSRYHLDTICSYALSLTQVYHINKDEIPPFTSNELFEYAVVHAASILEAKPIRTYLALEYEHLIVDEYQDCTLSQHQMILAIGLTLKTHILGDPLQGIFGFRGQGIVDFSDPSLSQFNANSQTLDTPWRWRNAGKEALGIELADIRLKLAKNEPVNLGNYQQIEVVIAPENDYTQPGSPYKQVIFDALSGESVLLIHPMSQSDNPRVKFIQMFPQLGMIESIDNNLFYTTCDSFDKLDGQALVASVVDMCRRVGSKTGINNWFSDAGLLKNKRMPAYAQTRERMQTIINALATGKSYSGIASLIESIKSLPGVKIYRQDFVQDICHALREADRLGIKALESIERNRNILRRKGRKIHGRGIGTTLLTKGLEFDTVVVLNAHQFPDAKHLYVALTRCCKRLIVISNTSILNQR